MTNPSDEELGRQIFDKHTEHLDNAYKATEADIDAVEAQLDTLETEQVAAVLAALGDDIEGKRAGAQIIAVVNKVVAAYPMLITLL